MLHKKCTVVLETLWNINQQKKTAIIICHLVTRKCPLLVFCADRCQCSAHQPQTWEYIICYHRTPRQTSDQIMYPPNACSVPGYKSASGRSQRDKPWQPRDIFFLLGGERTSLQLRLIIIWNKIHWEGRGPMPPLYVFFTLENSTTANPQVIALSPPPCLGFLSFLHLSLH